MLRHLSHLDSNKNQAFKKIKLKNGMKEIEIFLFLMFCSLVAVFVVDFLGWCFVFSAADIAENLGEAVWRFV